MRTGTCASSERAANLHMCKFGTSYFYKTKNCNVKCLRLLVKKNHKSKQHNHLPLHQVRKGSSQSAQSAQSVPRGRQRHTVGTGSAQSVQGVGSVGTISARGSAQSAQGRHRVGTVCARGSAQSAQSVPGGRHSRHKVDTRSAHSVQRSSAQSA